MGYKATEITAYLTARESADADAADQAGKAIAAAWNDREFRLDATVGPLKRCALDSPGMAPAAAVLDRLARQFGVFVHPVPRWGPDGQLPRLPAPSPQPTRTCQRCDGSYRCDRTRMSESGWCMRCRSLVEVPCEFCGTLCWGGRDGHRQCDRCRAVPLGVLQLEAKQAALLATKTVPRNGSDAQPATTTNRTVIRVPARPHPELLGTHQTTRDAPAVCASGGAGKPTPPDAHTAEQQATPARCRRRILITGSRTWDDRAVIRDALAAVWHPAAVLVSGASPLGADRLCEQCWEHWGGQVERHPADWKRHGRRLAGFIRNAELVEAGADVCLAFLRAGSAGTSDCIGRARRAGIPTRIFTSE